MTHTANRSALPVGIYVRISLDKHEGAGVERQEHACRALAAELGLEVGRVYSDNSISAYSGKTRPGFIDLVADVKARKIGAVLSFAPDRISRNVSEYGLFKATLKNTHCRLIYVNGGEQALDDPNADLISTMLSGVSQWESAIKSTRVAAAYAQQRARGDYPRKANRLFGYTHAGELHPTEAPLVRDAATRILAGDSLRSIAREWENKAVTTTGGSRPTAQSLRVTLLSPTTGGFTHYKLKKEDYTAAEWEQLSAWDRLGIIGRGNWEPVLDPEVWQALWAHLTNPARKTNLVGNTPQHLLSGIALCGKCGKPLYCRNKWYKKKTETAPKRVYYCKSTGGGHPTRIAEPLERYITDLVLTRLTASDIVGELAAGVDSDRRAELTTTRDRVRGRIADLEQQATLGNVGIDQFGRMNKGLTDQLAAIDAELVELAGAGGVLAELAEVADVRAWWVTATLELERELIRALMTITIEGTPPVQYKFNPEFITVEWKI